METPKDRRAGNGPSVKGRDASDRTSMAAILAISLIPDLDPICKALWMSIRAYENQHTGVAWPSRHKIALHLDVHVTTVDEHLEHLEQVGLLVRREWDDGATIMRWTTLPDEIRSRAEQLKATRMRNVRAAGYGQGDAPKLLQDRNPLGASASTGGGPAPVLVGEQRGHSSPTSGSSGQRKGSQSSSQPSTQEGSDPSPDGPNGTGASARDSEPSDAPVQKDDACATDDDVNESRVVGRHPDQDALVRVGVSSEGPWIGIYPDRGQPDYESFGNPDLSWTELRAIAEAEDVDRALEELRIARREEERPGSSFRRESERDDGYSGEVKQSLGIRVDGAGNRQSQNGNTSR